MNILYADKNGIDRSLSYEEIRKNSPPNSMRMQIDTKDSYNSSYDFIKNFLIAWLSKENKDICPDYAKDFFIKERYKFDENILENIDKFWYPRYPVFKRMKKPQYNFYDLVTHLKTYEKVVKYEKEKNFLKYLDTFHGYMPLRQKSQDFIRVSKFWLNNYKPKFARCGTYYENDERYSQYSSRTCGVHSSCGYEVGRHLIYLPETIPQIEWLNYYSKELVEKIGEEKIKSLKEAYLVEKINEGYYIQSYADHKLIGTEEGLKIELKIMEHLGLEHFYFRSLARKPEDLYNHSLRFFDEEKLRRYQIEGENMLKEEDEEVRKIMGMVGKILIENNLLKDCVKECEQ